MNYLREINAFIDWLETNPLDAITQALWFHLMAINNKCNWLEWFAVANLTLQAKLGVDKKTVIKHRNILRQKGLIDYKNQGRSAGKYKMISLCGEKNGGNNPPNPPPEEDMRGNNPPKCPPNLPPKWEPKCPPLDKLNETNLSSSSCNSRANEIKSILQSGGILVPTIDEVQAVEYWVDQGIDLDAVKFATKISALANKRSTSYIQGILRNWYRAGIRTREQAEEEVDRFNQEKGGQNNGPGKNVRQLYGKNNQGQRKEEEFSDIDFSKFEFKG